MWSWSDYIFGGTSVITLYSSDTCIPCKQLKDYLNRKGYKYIVKNREVEQNAKELFNLTGSIGVPVLKKDEDYIQGLNWAGIARLLK